MGFIDRQEPRIRAALKFLVEDGDPYVASRIAGVKIEEMNELRVKANIPIVV